MAAQVDTVVSFLYDSKLQAVALCVVYAIVYHLGIHF